MLGAIAEDDLRAVVARLDLVVGLMLAANLDVAARLDAQLPEEHAPLTIQDAKPLLRAFHESEKTEGRPTERWFSMRGSTK